VRKFWLMDQHEGDGPTALVETDGRLQIVDVIRFGSSLTELADQQKVWDDVIGRVAPTLKPFVDASTIDEEGVAPHDDLRRGDDNPGGTSRKAARGGGNWGQPGRTGGGGARRGSRGDR